MNRQDIIDLLGITETRLDNAIYSGQIPRPVDGQWGGNAKMYIDHWLEVLTKKRQEKRKESTTLSFYAQHQR